jgi:hypothetical protein
MEGCKKLGIPAFVSSPRSRSGVRVTDFLFPCRARSGTFEPLMSGGARDQEQPPKKLEWDWDLEHQDRAKEAKADRAVHNAQPFLVDRRVLKDVVKEKFQVDVARIVFLSSGAFHNLRNHSPPLIPFVNIAGTFHKVYPNF